MAEPKVFFDKTEVTTEVPIQVSIGKTKIKVLHIAYSKIISITFDHCRSGKLFGPKMTDRISLKLNGKEFPVEIKRCDHKQYFDQYVEGFRKFAADNKITLSDQF